MSQLLIENGSIVTLNPSREVNSPGYVWVEDDHIAAVGAGAAPAAFRQRADQVLDASNMAVIPGLVNAHVHAFQSFMRGFAGTRTLMPWLQEVAWPITGEMTEREVYLACMLTFIENIRGGATAVIDNQYAHGEPGNDEAACRAAEEAGLRYLLARNWADQNTAPSQLETADQIVTVMKRLHETWHGKANGRIRVEFGPIVPRSCSDETLERTRALAQEWGVGMHMHSSESQFMAEETQQIKGMRDINWLSHMGVLSPLMQVVHAVWLSDEEIALLAELGSVAVHCPVSNMFIASGIAPVARMRREGVTIALATDGQALNNGLEMIDVLKVTSNLQKVGTLDPTALRPDEILEMACLGGAAALGQSDLVGSLEVGKRADLVVVDMRASRLLPGESVENAVVNYAAAADIHTVIVDGKMLMHDKQITVIDEEAIVEEARRVREDLLKRVGLLPG